MADSNSTDPAETLHRIADQDIGGNCPWLADELHELARALELDMSGPATAPPRRWSFTRDELADVISHIEARVPASGPMAGKIDAGSMADAITEGLERRRAAIESCHFWDIRTRECRYEMLFLGCKPCADCPG